MIIAKLRSGKPANCEVCGVRIALELSLFDQTHLHLALEDDFLELSEILTDLEIEQVKLRCKGCNSNEDTEYMTWAWVTLCKNKIEEFLDELDADETIQL